MLITSGTLLKNARKQGYAIPHFNYWDSNSLRAEIAAAEKLNLPVICAWAQKHSPQITINDALALGLHFGAQARVPVVLHLDHGTDPKIIKWGTEHGFTSVMIDASDHTFADNVQITQDIVKFAHQRGVAVEAEIGHVGTNQSTDNSLYTETAAATSFAQQTQVDSLAVSIGTSHGVYAQGTPHLNFDRLQELRSQVAIPLVLHGGSSSGDENLNQAVRSGITKVNIYTDLANASLAAARSQTYPDEPAMAQAQREQIQQLAEHYFEIFETHKYQYEV